MGQVLSDNGTEFKNDLFDRVAKELGVEHKVYSPPYHPQSNGRIEGFHLFLKACMAKHISPGLDGMRFARLQQQHTISCLMSMPERALSF